MNSLEGKVALVTGGGNKRSMGHHDALIYLANPATAAAPAVYIRSWKRSWLKEPSPCTRASLPQ